MSYHVILRGQLHRTRYVPDSPVKCVVAVHCIDRVQQQQGCSRSNTSASLQSDISRLEVSCSSLVNPSQTAVDTSVSVVTLHSLTVQLIGQCNVDVTRIRCPSSLTKHEPVVSPDAALLSSDGQSDARFLFCSPMIEPFSPDDVYLPVCEQRTAAVLFRLPPGIPPTYRGQCVRFSYFIHVACVWSVQQQQNSSITAPSSLGASARTITTLRVPVRVNSPLAVLTQLSAPYTSRDFDFEPQAVVMPSGPSPGVCAPLSDALIPREAPWKQHTSSSPAQYVADASMRSLDKQSVPTDYLVRHDQTPALSLLLLSSAVTLGDSIRGVLTKIPNNEVVIVKVSCSVESVETVPKSLLQKSASSSVVVTPTNAVGLGRSRLNAILVEDSSSNNNSPSEQSQHQQQQQLSVEKVVAQCTVVDEQQWILCDALQTPFCFSLSPSKFAQSFSTDVVSLEWRLRFRFWSCSATDMSSTRPVKSINDLYQELEIPVTIYSPTAVQNPRIGAILCSP